MKNIIAAFVALAVLSFTAVRAQEVSPGTVQTQSVQQDEKVKIKSEELPEAVKTTLKGADYSGWTVDVAYHIKAKDHYEVTLKNGAETKTVKFDKDGNVIE